VVIIEAVTVTKM